MLSDFVGKVDPASAAVLVAAFACACIVCTSLIVKRRSRIVIGHEFELAKIKQHDETAVRMYQAETTRDYQIKQLDQNLITSHRVDTGDSK